MLLILVMSEYLSWPNRCRSRVHVSRPLLIRRIVSPLCPFILTLHCTYWAHGSPWDRSSVEEKCKTEGTSVTINARVETDDWLNIRSVRDSCRSWRHSSRKSRREREEEEWSNPTETNDLTAHAMDVGNMWTERIATRLKPKGKGDWKSSA